jgi:tRNA pseudouridine13 synthase
MVHGDFEGAVRLYLEDPLGLPQDRLAAWTAALDARDWPAALRLLDQGAEAERALLHRMHETGDALQAILVFPTTLQRLFVHALQSMLFNRLLARRLAEGLSHTRAEIGDLAAPVEDGRLVEAWTPVTPANLERVRNEIARGRAAVTGLLPGTQVPFAEGVAGRLEREILREAALESRDFLIPEHLDWSSKGTRRSLHLRPRGFHALVEEDEVFPGKRKATFTFELPAGAYATTVLREFLKSPRASDYA